MGIETAARRIEREAQQNPEAAAQSIALLADDQQKRILAQMARDAQQVGTYFNLERDPNTGEITALEFGPIYKFIHTDKVPTKDPKGNDVPHELRKQSSSSSNKQSNT